MSKIPQPTKEAINEAYYKILRKDLKTLNSEQIQKHLKKFDSEFKKRQPVLFKFITDVCKGHMEITNNMILTPQLILYVMVIIDSLYIQEEVDDIGNVFNQGEE